MQGPLSVKINFRDVSSFISIDSLKDFTIRAEGRVLWDFMTDSISLEARSGIFAPFGLTEGDYQSFKHLPVEVFHYGERKFAGWISEGVWDKSTRRLSLDCSSVGMIIKDFPAGLYMGSEDLPVMAFTSLWSDLSDLSSLTMYPSMTPAKVLEILTRNMNGVYMREGWIQLKDYPSFRLGTPDVSVRDFAENYTVSSGAELDAGDYQILSIRYETITRQFYLITRKTVSGYWKYYRKLITGSGLSGSYEFIGYYHGSPAFPYETITSDPTYYDFESIYHGEKGEIVQGIYQTTPSYSDAIPDAVKEYLSGLYDLQEDGYRDRAEKGSFWFCVGKNLSGHRVFLTAQIIHEDKYQFEYSADATVGQVLSDLAIMTDALVSFDYTYGYPRFSLKNREASTPARTNGLLDIKRKFTEHAEQSFTAPEAYSLLDTVRAGIEAFYLERLARESEYIEVQVKRDKVEDVSVLIPGNRLIDVEEGDLGQIIAVTPGEFDFSISCRKRANS